MIWSIVELPDTGLRVEFMDDSIDVASIEMPRSNWYRFLDDLKTFDGRVERGEA